MPKTYVTFGQAHRHEINGVVYDKDCVAVIECDSGRHGREQAFALFGPVFCFEYHERLPDMNFFPRGLIPVATQ